MIVLDKTSKILVIGIPVICILSQISKSSGGINDVLALGAIFLVAMLVKKGIRALREKNSFGWVMLAAAVALFFYMDSRSPLYYSIMVGGAEALGILLPIASVFLFAIPLISIFF